jgi:DNA (cytosine-5)-methyltransferase 1
VNYYNDNDPKACAWLRELIAAGEIAPGHVDERSILEIKPDDLAGFDQCHFFAGIGGWALALRWAGLEGVGGIWTGSCPCQPFSCAGKGKGAKDERHLWPAFRELIKACSPLVVFGEQVASAAVVGRAGGRARRGDPVAWLDGVLSDMEAAHYAVGAVDLPAACVGAPHCRQRLFWVADGIGAGLEGLPWHGDDGEQPGRERAHAAEHVAEGGATGGMADAEHDGGRADQPGREAQGRGADGRDCAMADAAGGQREQFHGGQVDGVFGPSDDGAVGFVGNSERTRRHVWRKLPRGCLEEGGGNETTQRSELWDKTQGAGAYGAMGDPACGDERRLRESGAVCGRPGASGGSSAWLDFRVILCRDGKARRVPVEPALFPLAHGVPNRVGLLRGYGNAIVPEVAEAFVRAWMECRL